jgi:hypothetical protein
MQVRSSIRITLSALSISLCVKAGDIEDFIQKADALSKRIRLVVRNNHKRPKQNSDIAWEQETSFELESNGFPYSIRYKGVGYGSPLPKKLGPGVSSYRAFVQELWIGREQVLQRECSKLTPSGSTQLTQLIQEYRRLESPSSGSSQLKAALVGLKKEILFLNDLHKDQRILAGGILEFSMRDQSLPSATEPTRYLQFQGHSLSGQNPSSNMLGFKNAIKSVENSWQVDARSGVQNAADLKQLGLLDSDDLKFARVSVYNIPFDAPWPGTDVSSTGLMLSRRASLPGWPGGPKSVQVGVNHFGPSFSPLHAFHPENGTLLSTFMVDASNKTPLNSQMEFDRGGRGGQLRVPTQWQDTLFPIAGMDQENRVFAVTWIAMPGDNGVVFLVQYQDETRPRIAFVDASGVVFRVRQNALEVGLKALQTRIDRGKILHEEVLWSANKTTLSGQPNKNPHYKPEATLKVLQSLGEYKPDGLLALRQGDEWQSKEVTFFMPRALW